MSLGRRISAGIGANVFGQMITIAMQVLALPLFLRHWDASRYGTWLMITAIPSYFSMADVGMVTAAGNKMTMEMGRGETATATRTFQSALVFTLCSSAVIAAILFPILAVVDIQSLRNSDYKLTLASLVGCVLLAFFNGISEAAFRATGRYGFGTSLGQLTRLGEWMGGMVGLWLYGSFLSVAFGMLVSRALGLTVAISCSMRSTKGIKWGFSQASVTDVRSMVKPAIMFMVMPLANALSFQGFTLLVGGLFGALSVAVFNTYRTIARVSVQMTSVLSFAVGPELSRLYGASNEASLRKLFRSANFLSLCLAVGLPLLMGILARPILSLWTHDRIGYQGALLFLMLLYAGVSSSWHVPRVFLLSINQHSGMSGFFLLTSLLSLATAWYIGQSASLNVVVMVLIAGEFTMALVVQKMAFKTLSTTLSNDGRLEQALPS
jgi:O-antigen/teichoic acid export membrane protein